MADLEGFRRSVRSLIRSMARATPSVIWCGILCASKVARTHWAVIYAVVAAVIVYIVCTCVELLRQRLFKAVGTCYGKTGCYRKEQKLCEKINFMLFENDTNQEDKNERI